MSWLRKLFGGDAVGPPRNIGILVRGTLLHATSGVLQLKMMGLEDKVRGIAAVFGSEWDRLEVEERPNVFSSPKSLEPPWILVIPEDAYDRYRFDFHEVAGKPLDGRVEWKKVEVMGSTVAMPPTFNINRATVERVGQLVEQWRFERPDKADKTDAPAGRVAVGTCSACGRELKMKASAVKPKMNLTCKCGAKNLVEAASQPLPQQG